MSKSPDTTIDVLELIKDGRHFAEKKGNQIFIIDSLTGNTIAMYADTTLGVPTNFDKITLANGSIAWVQNGLNPQALERGVVTYNPLVIDIICQRIAEGGSLTAICKELNMPSYQTLCRWRRAHPSIDEQLQIARRDRAEYLRDEALAEAKSAEGRDPISGSQLRVDTLKWAASVDHERYNPKTKVEATINAPTQILVYTGIDRETPVEMKDAKVIDVD